MSTLSPLRPASPDRPAWDEDPSARAARLRLRRRLVRWSLPVALLLVLVALKLLTVVGLGIEARDAFAVGNISAVESAAARLGFLNVIEPHKAPFARGDARVLAGDFEGARAAFEEALALAPAEGAEACQIRVNLVRSLLKLADAATRSGADSPQPYADRVTEVVGTAPPGCFDGDTGQQLRDARQEAQQQGAAKPQQNPDPGKSQPTPNAAGQDKQQQLDSKTRDNLQQRGQGDQRGSNDTRAGVAKPW